MEARRQNLGVGIRKLAVLAGVGRNSLRAALRGSRRTLARTELQVRAGLRVYEHAALSCPADPWGEIVRQRRERDEERARLKLLMRRL